MSDRKPLLEIEGLEHSYAGRQVLKGLSFTMDQGEIFGLLGPNGSGKSTALKVLAGLQAQQGGSVRWEGKEVNGSSRELRSRLGVVFQSPSVDPKLSARENLELAGRLHAMPKALIRERAEEGLQRAGLLDRAGDVVKTFSGGMKRRLDLARALMHQPALLLMDEPTAGLDEPSFRDTWQLLEDMREKQGLSILVATHRPDEAARCDRLAILSDGEVALIESPAELQGRVGQDVIGLTSDAPEALQAELKKSLNLEGLLNGGDLLIECEKGHELIPRIVEALPEGRLSGVSLRRPTLADAFLKIVGRSLDGDPDDTEAAA